MNQNKMLFTVPIYPQIYIVSSEREMLEFENENVMVLRKDTGMLFFYSAPEWINVLAQVNVAIKILSQTLVQCPLFVRKENLQLAFHLNTVVLQHYIGFSLYRLWTSDSCSSAPPMFFK